MIRFRCRMKERLHDTYVPSPFAFLTAAGLLAFATPASAQTSGIEAFKVTPPPSDYSAIIRPCRRFPPGKTDSLAVAREQIAKGNFARRARRSRRIWQALHHSEGRYLIGIAAANLGDYAVSARAPSRPASISTRGMSAPRSASRYSIFAPASATGQSGSCRQIETRRTRCAASCERFRAARPCVGGVPGISSRRTAGKADPRSCFEDRRLTDVRRLAADGAVGEKWGDRVEQLDPRLAIVELAGRDPCSGGTRRGRRSFSAPRSSVTLCSLLDIRIEVAMRQQHRHLDRSCLFQRRSLDEMISGADIVAARRLLLRTPVPAAGAATGR